MTVDRVSDALDGLSAREAERLVEAAQKRLRRCLICEQDGAMVARVSVREGSGTTYATVMICPACFERHRLPASRSADAH